MARSDKPKLEFETVASKPIDVVFDEIANSMPLTQVDRALGHVSVGSLPLLLALAEDDQLHAALVAVDPKLSLDDVDEGCGKLEDLAIALLTATRNCRHEVRGLIDANSRATLAAKVMGPAAGEALDKLADADLLSEAEIDQRRKLLRNANKAESKRSLF